MPSFDEIMMTKLLKACAQPAIGSRNLALVLAILLVLSAGYRPAVAQTFTEFAITTGHGSLDGITAGPDGALWFTESGGFIGRITTAGVVTDFPIPTANSNPTGIAAGPDGALWFTEAGDTGFYAGGIGRITTAGVITEFPLPGGPSAITTGGLTTGGLWFTESTANKIRAHHDRRCG
jgi:virginiamycin B lyase